MAERDVTGLINRLDVMENRLAIRLEALYGELDDGYLQVNGQVYPASGQEIDRDIEIVLDCHDEKGRLIGQNTHYVTKENFFGFESFTMQLEVRGKPVKIQIYPRIG